jgi:CrcB-like protein, Camphor Resistance (CrcB)/Cytidylate kinase-like family
MSAMPFCEAHRRMKVITITREYGSGGGEVARRLAERLGWELLDHALPVALSSSSNVGHDLKVITGFLGGYTTFSTFEYDSATLWERGETRLVAVNFVGSVAAGFVAVLVGIALARSLDPSSVEAKSPRAPNPRRSRWAGRPHQALASSVKATTRMPRRMGVGQRR